MASSAVTIKIEKATLQLLEELREETNSIWRTSGDVEFHRKGQDSVP